MELNVPTSGTASHESPAVVQLHEDTKVPVSEIKAKLHDKIMELNKERLSNPSDLPFNNTTENMKEQGYKEVENELLHPEETQTSQDEEFKNFFGDAYPGSEAFDASVDETGFEGSMDGGIGGDFGGGIGGDFGGGIDNNAMGFSDADMDTLNTTADNAFDDFTGDEGTESASDVNNISMEEPGATEEDATYTATDAATEDSAEEPVAAEL